MPDRRPSLHVFHIGKSGGTALGETLLAYADASHFRLVFGGHTLTERTARQGEEGTATGRVEITPD